MANSLPLGPSVGVRKVTKIETTYEYAPILGDILGYWVKLQQNRLGSVLEIHVAHPLEHYDRVVINGIEVKREDSKEA